MILEFRSYTLAPRVREEFVTFFETESIPRMREVGMTVIGQFSSVTDETGFAYVRTFDTLEQREQQYRAFYESEDWLGWMIDFAIGKEESFEVFLGESSPSEVPVPDVLSGVHAARFTLASSKGVLDAVDDAQLSVTEEGGTTANYRLGPETRIFRTPTGSGMGPATPIGLGELAAGDHLLVLGAATGEGPQARQIVQRPLRKNTG